MLEPHASQFVDTGPSWFGATNHYLALLASTLDRPDEADARFADAASAYERLAWIAGGGRCSGWAAGGAGGGWAVGRVSAGVCTHGRAMARMDIVNKSVG
jgi:hypothetical protein